MPWYSCVRSIGITSLGSSTTQIRSWSRRGSWQIRQRVSSVRLKQTSHRPIFSLTSRIASASAAASSAGGGRGGEGHPRGGGGAGRGSPPQPRHANPAEAAQVESAGGTAEPALGELLGHAQRLVDG